MAKSSNLGLTFKVGNYGQEPVAVAFEPTGMSYDLAPGRWLTIKVSEVDQRDIEITHSPECISLWLWGNVVILDSEGNMIDHIS